MFVENRKNQNEMNGAIEHFQQAAQSESEAGQQAKRELVRIDLPSNPSRYVASRAVIDKSNIVWTLIGNQTGTAIKNIEISYAWLDERNQTQTGKIVYPGPLPSGKQDSVRIGLRLNQASELSQRVRVEITSASIAE